MKRYLVTGATGYIGRKLVSRLAKDGHFVYVLVRQVDKALFLFDNISQIKIQTDVSLFVNSIPDNIDCVFHLAAAINNEKNAGDIELIAKANILFPSILLHAMAEKTITSLVTTGTYWQTLSSNEPVARS
jgi:nucleoside-diphosphate-sugar epimerase